MFSLIRTAIPLPVFATTQEKKSNHDLFPHTAITVLKDYDHCIAMAKGYHKY